MKKMKWFFLMVLFLSAFVMGSWEIASLTGTKILNAKDSDKIAQFPSNPIRIIIPGSAGGVNDRGARLIAPFFKKYLGVSVFIENVPGAEGIIAYNKAFKARPDGYNLLSVNFVAPVVLELTRKTDYVTKEFSYVCGWNANNYVIAVNSDNWETFSEFLTAAKQKKLTLAATGGATDLQGRLLEDGLGIKFNWVRFGSGQEGITAVAGKHVDTVLTMSVPAMPMVRAGKLRALAVFSEKRDAILPGISTMKELGYDNVTCLNIMGGFAAPPKTPTNIINLLEQAIEKVTEDAEFVKLAETIGVMVYFRTSAEVNKLVYNYYALMNQYKDIFK